MKAFQWVTPRLTKFPVTTVLGQIANNSVHPCIIGGINKGPPLLTLVNESRVTEFLEMERQRRGRNI
jgi:hypothetical protein